MSEPEASGRNIAQGQELIALVDRFKALSAQERVALASREALTENEQLVLSTFADDEPQVAKALLARPDTTSAAAGVAETMPWASPRRWWHPSESLERWASKSVPRALLLVGCLTAVSVAIAIFPDAFDDGGRLPTGRTGTRIMGVVGVFLFGATGLFLVLEQLRRRR